MSPCLKILVSRQTDCQGNLSSGVQFQRTPELDGIRGVAALMVVFYHAFFWSMTAGTWSGVSRLVASITQIGWLGVDLFFVLSGFLISSVLLRTKGKARYFKNFYARRALRILPVYYGLLVVLTFLNPARNFTFVLISLVFLSNMAPLLNVPMQYGPLWSLSVEEHFYLGWPLIVFLFSPTALTIISSAVVLLEPLVRLWGFARGSDIFGLSWYRFDGLALGSLAAIFAQSRYRSRRSLTAFAIISAVIAGAFSIVGHPFGIWTRTHPVGAALQFTCSELIFIAFIAIVVAWSGTQFTLLLRVPVLRFLGEISYCLYVVHVLIFQLWDELIKYGMFSFASQSRLDRICLSFLLHSPINRRCGHVTSVSRESHLRLKRNFAECSRNTWRGFPRAMASSARSLRDRGPAKWRRFVPWKLRMMARTGVGRPGILPRACPHRRRLRYPGR